MKSIETYAFRNKKVLVRVDFNVPLNDQLGLRDNTRIRAALPTIQQILQNGGAVILMSHLGRPADGPEDRYSLKHVVPELRKLLGQDILFAEDCVGQKTLNLKENLKAGQVLLLENLRFYPEEQAGDLEFSRKLAQGADVYVNDAFGTAHRAHASTTIVAQFFPEERMFGYLINKELDSMDRVIHSSESPFTTIMGGAKVSDKILIIEHLLPKLDYLLIGGGMSYTFVKALGGNIGNSLCENEKLDLALELLKKAEENGVSLLLPEDSVNADAFSEDAHTEITPVDQIKEGWIGLDIGPQTIKKFDEVIRNSKTVLWNGPMGVFEMSRFAKGTTSVAQSVARATSGGAFSLIGGGDSVAAINKYKLTGKVSFVSTGGGAMLEYLEGKELPGISAIRR